MKILLVAGGVLTNPAALLRKIAPAAYDCIIAVDHGFDHCAALGLKPDILMGDLDSVEDVPASPALQIIPFAPEKDDTDLRLAAKHTLTLGARAIDIICATGGRLDQFMGNLSLLEFLQEEAPHLPVRMIDEGNVIRLLVAEPVAEGMPLRTTQNAAQSEPEDTAPDKAQAETQHQSPARYPRRSKYISVIPVTSNICFSGQGLKYPAQHLSVQRSNMISISNEAVGDDYAITLHSGKALLIEAD